MLVLRRDRVYGIDSSPGVGPVGGSRRAVQLNGSALEGLSRAQAVGPDRGLIGLPAVCNAGNKERG
jgi:hypothetical protein